MLLLLYVTPYVHHDVQQHQDQRCRQRVRQHSVTLSISGFESARDRHQCCVCELYDWVFVGFGEGETCQRCGHVVREWCAVCQRLTEQIIGA
jgi:hypothetical protein